MYLSFLRGMYVYICCSFIHKHRAWPVRWTLWFMVSDWSEPRWLLLVWSCRSRKLTPDLSHYSFGLNYWTFIIDHLHLFMSSFFINLISSVLYQNTMVWMTLGDHQMSFKLLQTSRRPISPNILYMSPTKLGLFLQCWVIWSMSSLNLQCFITFMSFSVAWLLIYKQVRGNDVR